MLVECGQSNKFNVSAALALSLSLSVGLQCITCARGNCVHTLYPRWREKDQSIAEKLFFLPLTIKKRVRSMLKKLPTIFFERANDP